MLGHHHYNQWKTTTVSRPAPACFLFLFFLSDVHLPGLRPTLRLNKLNCEPAPYALLWLRKTHKEAWETVGNGGKRKKAQILKLPSVVAQLLLQLRDLVQFVEEPLVDGRQLMDAIHAHATMEGLGRREKNKISKTDLQIAKNKMHWCLSFPFTSGSIGARSRKYWHKIHHAQKHPASWFRQLNFGLMPFQGWLPSRNTLR